jgi:hypothetical protein
MDLTKILQSIDSQIKRLQEAKRILEGFEGHGTTAKSTRNRRERRKMSKAARDRIAAAQRARWAKVKAGKKK